jgi:hypothetical protein
VCKYVGGQIWPRETYSSPVSSVCDSSDSMPARSCSSDRAIWASWLLGERLSEMARWRSSRDSLMWSASRNSCGGLVAIVIGEVWRNSGGACYVRRGVGAEPGTVAAGGYGRRDW